MFRLLYLLGIFTLIFVAVEIPSVHVSVHELFLFGATAVWLFEYVLHQGRAGWSFPVHPFWIAGLLVLLGGLVSMPGAVSPLGGLVVTVKTVFVLTLWISMTMVMVRRGGFWQIMWVLVAALAVEAAIVLSDRVTGYDLGGRISGRSFFWWGRSDGTLTYPNELAFFTSTGLPLLLGMIFYEFENRQRAWAIGLLGMVLAGTALTVYFSGSNAGFGSSLISLGALLLFVFLRGGNRRRFELVGLLAVAGVALALYLLVPERLTAVSQFLSANLSRGAAITGPSRLLVMLQGVEAMADNPFIGFGMDQTGTGGLVDAQRVTSVGIHNVIVAGWVGGGILALIGLVLGYGFALLTALNALWRGSYRRDWMVVALGACTLGWIFFDQTQPSLHHRTSWFVVALLYGLGYGVRVALPAWHTSLPVNASRVGGTERV